MKKLQNQFSIQKIAHKKVFEEIEKGKLFSCMADTEHLDEAKKALAKGYKLNSNPLKTEWGRVNDAKKHLKAIGPESSEYITAQRLMHKTHTRERHIEHISINVANQIMIKQREMLTNELERYYVTRGIFVDIELSGPDKTFIKLSSSLFREASIDKIADGTKFFAHLKNAGFKRIILEDNEDNAWTYSFAKS
jgi:hypothetical protein